MFSCCLNHNQSTRSHAVILNRRMLLAALGLSLPAVAVEAAQSTKKKSKKPAQGQTVAGHKARKAKHPAAAAQS